MVDAPPPKKARKVAVVKPKAFRRGPGCLSRIVKLLVDALCEIAMHLDPLTLLYLSRTSKYFDRIFASKSSRFVWEGVRGNVGLPDLEADGLSELEYASLMFENEAPRRCRRLEVCRNRRLSSVLLLLPPSATPLDAVDEKLSMRPELSVVATHPLVTKLIAAQHAAGDLAQSA